MNYYLENDQAGKPLSDRQREVLVLVAAGHSNLAIALLLGVSLQTIKNTLTRVFLKLDAHNRTEAVILGVERGEIVLASGSDRERIGLTTGQGGAIEAASV